MKKKYLKKMLAIMLASMTVSATPGLVGAMKEESKKTIQDVNSQIANHTLTEEAATNMLDELEEMAKEDDEAKKEVSWTLGEMIYEGLFGKTSNHNDHMFDFDVHMCSPENLSKIIKIFKTCSTSDTAKRNTAWAIEAMAYEGLLGKASSKKSSLVIPQCSPGNLSDVIDILDKCLEYKDSSVKEADYFKAKQHVTNSVFQMARRGVLGESNFAMYGIGDEPFRKCPPEQIFKIIGFLEKCLKDNEKNVANDIAFLASKEVLDQYPKDKILNMLQECFKNPEAMESVAEALRICAAKNLLEKDSLGSILDILEKCLQNGKTANDVARTIWAMSEHDMFDSNSLDRILNILYSCSNSFYCHNGFYAISHAIMEMTDKGVINAQTINESLIQIFENCSKERYAGDYISDAIKNIAQKNLLNQCSPDKLKRIIDSLLPCREYNDLSKRNVSESIQAMAEQNILYRCEPNQIQEISGALADCLRKGSSFKHETINAIMAMNNKDLLNQCDSARIQQLTDTLIGCLESGYTRDAAANAILAINENGLLNKCEPNQIRQIVGNLTGLLENNNTREIAVTIIAAITRNNNVLGQLNPAEIQDLANSLPGDLANNNTREAATIIISAMAENPQTFNQFNHDQLREILNLFRTHFGHYLANGNYQMADRIFEVFKKCSKIEALKADVADIAEMLTCDGGFFQYIDENSATPRLGNFLDILTSCSGTQNTDTRKKAVFAIAHLISRTGKTITLSQEATDQITQRIPQIIEMLEESSVVYETKFDVSDIINLLGKRGFFNVLTHDQNRRLIIALDNCLAYNNVQISAMLDVDESQQNTASSVCSIFNENSWIIGFKARLLADDRALLDQVEFNARAAYENAFDYM